MTNIMLEELQTNFDAIMNRVENGESFLVESNKGSIMLVPYGDYNEVDDLIRIHTDHEEGC
jgi:hypothetical protein